MQYSFLTPKLAALAAFTATLFLAGELQQSPAAEPAQMTRREAEQHFRANVLPLLKEKCAGCHGDDPKEVGGKLDVRSRAALLKGGESGEPALIPGEPNKSRMFVAVTWENKDLQMPPKEQNRLSKAEVESLRVWIAAGAPWPEAEAAATSQPGWKEGDTAEGVVVATSGGQSPAWTERKYRPEDLWAYQPIRRYPVPAVNSADSTHPIDAFLHEKLQAKQIKPAAAADRLTLVRRATFDLTGLPPTPEEVAAFLADDSPNAYLRLIGGLLSSPRYGEQMARHWLDVARYADTAGFSNDFERPNAWRYRDYVVRSFNADKPFDRFIVEQIAGDELDPDNPEMHLAVGFLRMGPWEQTGMSVAAITRQNFLDDVTNSVGVTFLGQGLRCASCHDHKFDPVPTRDYYRLQAVFAPLQFAEREVAFLPQENTTGFDAGQARAEKLLKEAREFIARLKQKHDDAVAALLKERGVAKISDLPAEIRPQRHFGWSPMELSQEKIYRKRIDYFDRERMRYQPYVLGLYNGGPNNYTSNKALNPLPAPRARVGLVPVVHVLSGGSLETPGEEVTPGVLSAVHGSNDVLAANAFNSVPDGMEGRRLALAHWIASPQNTLTARVIVNRVWQWHFGRGIVATPNNFGKMGRKPTHPELLDWLATWFIEHDWSIKKLHRLIMTSAAYQQSSEHAEIAQARQIDPANELLAYFPVRRLAAEELRDAMLAVTGELNTAAGGPPVFPEINWEVALQPRHIMGSVAPAYQPSPRAEDRHRRTLYAFRCRTLPDPMLEVFNRPGSDTSCDCRDATTVAPQAFALWNGDFVHDRALALASRLEKQHKAATVGRAEIDQQIVLAFRLTAGRTPTSDELAQCRQHVERMTEHHRQHAPTRRDLPRNVRREMVEELTGESFHWDEDLDQMQAYQPDLKPWDASPETRALAELCLVLLNSNEFLHVR